MCETWLSLKVCSTDALLIGVRLSSRQRYAHAVAGQPWALIGVLGVDRLVAVLTVLTVVAVVAVVVVVAVVAVVAVVVDGETGGVPVACTRVWGNVLIIGRRASCQNSTGGRYGGP